MKDIRAQAGQLLIMGFDATAPTGTLRALLAAMQPGGIILFRRNIVSAEQTWELLRGCREVVSTPMFLCVDMEGGTVDRLKDAIAAAPSAAHVFATEKSKLFRTHGRLIGEEVRTLGFNTDFAPVLDLAFDAGAPVMGTRVVSRDPRHVVQYAHEFLRGLRDARVLGCGKHFPGLGEADLDTHNMLPLISKSMKALWNEDLYPFRELRRQMPFVMVAHAAYPQVTKGAEPASLSKKWMTDVLRKKIGYRGLIVSDDLEMGGVQVAASIEDAAVETLRAGADMYLICHSEERVWNSYETVVREAERDRKFAGRVREAAARVLRFKKASRELREFPNIPNSRTTRRLRERMEAFSAQVQRETVFC
jgi:beta-N-acetylhexosaminidase